MATYLEAGGIFAKQFDPKQPGIWQYQCNAASNPKFLQDIPKTDWRTKPNNSYYVIWNVNDSSRNAFTSSDTNWSDPVNYATNITRVWDNPAQARIFTVPFTGIYQISFKISIAYHEDLGTNGNTPTWAVDTSPMQFGIIIRRPGQPAFLPASHDDPDPLTEGIRFTPNTAPPTVFDYGTVATPNISDQRVMATNACPVLPRDYTTDNAINTPKLKGFTQDTCTVTVGMLAGSQLQMCVSNYTQVGDNADPVFDQVARTNFLPQLFDFRITYVNGDYKI